MQEAGVAKPFVTEWAFTVVFVPKRDGSLRFCAYYRRLNTVLLQDKYPNPLMDECIDSLGKAQIFSTLNANLGYWHIEMDNKDVEKTAFVTHHGSFKYSNAVCLKNTPATVQRSMDVIILSVNWQHVIVYMDDIIIFLKTPGSSCNT